MPRKFLKKYLDRYQKIHVPYRESYRFKSFARWFSHPNLLHLNRHSVAGGVAVGLFCGLLPAPFQMVSAAICTLVFKVNLPIAVITTFYTNPITFVPLYVAAYYIGLFITGDVANATNIMPPELTWSDFTQWIPLLFEWLIRLGKPLVLGVLVLASSLSLVGYFATQGLWRLYIRLAWRKRKKLKRIERKTSV